MGSLSAIKHIQENSKPEQTQYSRIGTVLSNRIDSLPMGANTGDDNSQDGQGQQQEERIEI
jgi:hypothetical protein